jgi:arsenate reductase
MYTSERFRALGDPTRLRCFRAVAAAGVALSVAELTDILQKPQYAISRALSELKKFGILSESRQGKLVFYQLDSRHTELVSLGKWVVDHCYCADDICGVKNPDGSTQPGQDPCAYDDERLRWRLTLRELIPSIITYRPRSIGGSGIPQENTNTTQTESEPKTRVLFVCVHNSARSQMAEEFLRLHGSNSFICESAGIKPGTVNPFVLEELSCRGIDISHKQPQAVADVFSQAKTFDWIITVCDPGSEKLCPVFPGPVHKFSWPFPDPTDFCGTDGEIKAKIHNLANSIESRVMEFITTQLHNNKEIPCHQPVLPL